MKKLSIEEKAKRYDKVIEQLSTMMPNWESLSYNGKTFLQDLVHIIPELKESEDERIRKQIMEHIMWSEDVGNCATEEKERWIAWLEKQGEHANFRNKIQIGDKVTRNEDGVLVNLSQLKRVAKKDEKQGEQKPADKVESKFHKGEWIITNKNHIWYVDETPETTSYLYRLINQYGKVEVAEFEIVDKKARLWTIQDAKDGDVLAAHECLVLFKEIDGLNIRCYCTYHYLNHQAFYVDTLQNKTAFHPATKEQRDQLEKAMANAGYTFDFEKKELKKIIQNPAWSEEDKYAIQVLKDIVKHSNEIDENIYTMPLKEKLYDWLKSLRPKSTWKPSDEQMEALANALSLAKNCGEESSYDLRTLHEQLKKLKS